MQLGSIAIITVLQVAAILEIGDWLSGCTMKLNVNKDSSRNRFIVDNG